MACAQGAATLDLGQSNGLPGTEVHVAVLLQTDVPVVAGEMEITHTSPFLELKPAQVGSSASAHKVQSSALAPGRQRLVFYSLSNAPLYRGTIVDLVVRLQPSAPDVTASLSLTNVVLVAGDGSIIQPVLASGGSASIATLRFDAVRLQTGGTVQLQLRGRSDERYIIQSAPDPNPVTWSNLSTNAATNGVIHVADPGATPHAKRFYRAVGAP